MSCAIPCSVYWTSIYYPRSPFWRLCHQYEIKVTIKISPFDTNNGRFFTELNVPEECAYEVVDKLAELKEKKKLRKFVLFPHTEYAASYGNA